MEINKVILGDCIEVMQGIPDKSIDLLLTDPPYGLGDRLSDGGGKLKNTPMAKLYRESNWEDVKPNKEYFDEMFRISKNQIICGGNYFTLPNTRGFIVWDKKQSMPTLSACEYIWTSFDCPSKIFSCSSNDLRRTHPTQKPIKLFEWLINKFSKEGDLILDPFAGSGTTAIACIRQNRNYILIEKEQKYYDICVERIRQENEKIKIEFED